MFSPWAIRPGLTFWGCTQRGALTRQLQIFRLPPPPGFVPTALALNCGQYCISRGQKGLIAHLLPDILPDGGTDAELHAMDVTAHVTGRYPPCFVMTANNDFLKEQAPLMTAALERCGVPCVYRCYGDETQKLGHVFHCNIRAEAAQNCNTEECDFFKRFMG